MTFINIIFVTSDGVEHEIKAEVGGNLLQIAQENGFELEGACEGNMACSTCHLILDPIWYPKLPDPSIDEEEMLDLAVGLTATSRLGCQVWLTDDLDGLRVFMPAVHSNMLGL